MAEVCSAEVAATMVYRAARVAQANTVAAVADSWLWKCNRVDTGRRNWTPMEPS